MTPARILDQAMRSSALKASNDDLLGYLHSECGTAISRYLKESYAMNKLMDSLSPSQTLWLLAAISPAELKNIAEVAIGRWTQLVSERITSEKALV